MNEWMNYMNVFPHLLGNNVIFKIELSHFYTRRALEVTTKVWIYINHSFCLGNSMQSSFISALAGVISKEKLHPCSSRLSDWYNIWHICNTCLFSIEPSNAPSIQYGKRELSYLLLLCFIYWPWFSYFQIIFTWNMITKRTCVSQVMWKQSW